MKLATLAGCAALVVVALGGDIPAASTAEEGPDALRVWVDPEPLSLEAVPVLSMQLRKRKSLRLVSEPREADVRVEVLEAALVGERRVVVQDTGDPGTRLRPVPPPRQTGADVEDTRRYVIVARVTAVDRVEELQAPRAITLHAAAKGLAGEIEGWIRRHRAEILGARRRAP